jgi:anti-sigma B factor antagonist
MLPDPTIGITHVPAGDVWQVHIRGEHDLSTVQQVAEVLDGLPAASRVVIDLTETTFIDSTVIGLLLDRAPRRRAAGGASAVVSAEATFPRRVIDMVGLPETLPVYETAAEAFEGLAGIEQPEADPDPV